MNSDRGFALQRGMGVRILPSCPVPVPGFAPVGDRSFMSDIPESGIDEVVDVLQTPADFVRWGASAFAQADLAFGHGLENALDEAYYLVRHSLNLPHEVPELYMRARLLPEERMRVAQCIRSRIAQRRPAAYLTGEAWFCGLRFRVDERVIVPRSPLAELIGDAFAPWLPQPPARILDLCSGSGCIAIACAMIFPEAEVHAVEIDPGAAELMFANIADHGMQDRVIGHVGDLYAPLAAQKVPAFDLIVTNPPYVPEDEWQDLPAEYHAEPKVALAAGDDGMEVVARLLREAPDWLSQDGVLIGEIGASTAEFDARFPDLPAHWPEFEFGGSGVFIIGRAALVDWLAQQ